MSGGASRGAHTNAAAGPVGATNIES